MRVAVKQQGCQSNLIAAYIDGELDSRETLLFEAHLADCGECRGELLLHQQFICELDAALTQKDEVAVPANFSRIIAARAVSDMSGMRSRTEHRKALLFVVVLAVTSFALLGTSASQFVILFVQRAVGKVWAVIGLVWATSYDALASIVVIGRVITKRFVVEPSRVGLLLVVLAVAGFLLSRLLSKYQRLSADE